ncbi:MAG: lamin tail domain-containing protein [Bacteroidota bacterium]
MLKALRCLLPFFLLNLSTLSAQLQDSFDDGDFTQNPSWQGETGRFLVVNGVLESNGASQNDTIYLSTPYSLSGEAEWRLSLGYASGPSSSNFTRFYLVADQGDLLGSLNGYFVQAGETGSNDSYDLFRQDGSSAVKIIDGVAGRAGSGISGEVRVLRTATGDWELYTDPESDGSFFLEGSTTDNTYAPGGYVGWLVRHSSSRAKDYSLDNVYAGPVIQDTLAPSLQQVNVLSANSLELIFSEALDKSTAENTANYQLDQGLGNPAQASLSGTASQVVQLNWTGSFQNQQSYQLGITGLTDEAGNGFADTLGFQYLVADVALFQEVIFNELLPDPTPRVGLPEAEFVELYNRSQKVISLENWTLFNGSTTATLPAHFLLPGEYVVLVDASDVNLFSGINQVLGLNSWPALVNSGDELELKNASGELIDALSYTTSWYRDGSKDDGGYSLELINPDDLACPPIANWRASTAQAGGTPGATNAVFNPNPDISLPTVESIAVTGDNVLEVCFDKPMDPTEIIDPLVYLIDQGVGNPEEIEIIDANNQCVELIFLNVIQQGQVYQLSISGVSDCRGNVINATSVEVVKGEIPEPGEVVINEIFPDYTPSQGLPEAEFVELYNPTSKVLELNGALLSDGGTPANLGLLNLNPGEYVILADEDDASAFASFGRVIAVDGLPGLNNDTDSLYLRRSDGILLDRVFYDQSWYRDAAKSSGGWTLERIDALAGPCNQAGNWIASTALLGGTPGQENSQIGTYSDTEAPVVTQVSLPSANTLLLTFNEEMEGILLEDISLYSGDQGLGTPLLAMAEQPHLRRVLLTFDQSFVQNQVYTLTVTGLKDCSGNDFSDEIPFGLAVSPEAGDVLINEILFNPYSGASDFVEIVNVSENILDLADMRIGEIFPETDSVFNSDPLAGISTILLPGQYVCLTADPAIQQQIYLPLPEARFQETEGFPSFDDAAGEVVIFRNDGVFLDRFAYLDDFHYATLADDNGVSLERISLKVPTQRADNWHSAASTVRYATPGYVNSQVAAEAAGESEVWLSKQTFSPNFDGVDDVLEINYDFDFNGANARIFIFDQQGRLVRTLLQNSLLGTEAGSFFWDGATDASTQAPIGMYVVVMEVTNDQTGEKMAYRRVGVLAGRIGG